MHRDHVPWQGVYPDVPRWNGLDSPSTGPRSPL
jgi:hypothetical protein